MSEHVFKVFASKFWIEFDSEKDKNQISNIFKALLEKLFYVGSKNDVLVGHVKLFGKGFQGMYVKGNVTGKLENLKVEIEGGREKRIKMWLNIISHQGEAEKIKSNFCNVLREFEDEMNVRIENLEVVL
ncbi:MAG: hypothetical protein ACE5KE_07000 [Methanosarcinales archaeon]